MAYSAAPASINPAVLGPIYKEVHLKVWNLRGWKASRTEEHAGSVFYGDHKLQVLTAPLGPSMSLASIRYSSPKAMPKEKVDLDAQALASGLRA
jgi:hypothetical protein